MLFGDGYRPNVCIVLCNAVNQVMLFRRIGSGGWQFPQGGIDESEDPITAMYRELYEEVGLSEKDVHIIAHTHRWYRYNVPDRWLRASSRGTMHGQKQLWFLLQLVERECSVNFQTTDHPEFDDWAWVSYWEPVRQVVDFKRSVYQRAMAELAEHLPAGRESVHRMFMKCASHSHLANTMAA